jgi:hypothetical protein
MARSCKPLHLVGICCTAVLGKAAPESRGILFKRVEGHQQSPSAFLCPSWGSLSPSFHGPHCEKKDKREAGHSGSRL